MMSACFTALIITSNALGGWVGGGLWVWVCVCVFSPAHKIPVRVALVTTKVTVGVFQTSPAAEDIELNLCPAELNTMTRRRGRKYRVDLSQHLAFHRVQTESVDPWLWTSSRSRATNVVLQKLFFNQKPSDLVNDKHYLFWKKYIDTKVMSLHLNAWINCVW